MCHLLGVSASGYYKAQDRKRRPPVSQATMRPRTPDPVLITAIKSFASRTRQCPGYRQVAAYLHNQGFHAGTRRVRRLMRKLGLQGKRCRRFVRTTDSSQTLHPFPNLLKRDFRPGRLNRFWCGDITYIHTDQGFLYLATVEDLGSRRILGYSLSTSIDAKLVISALEDAYFVARPKDGVIFHCDQGSQYNSRAFRAQLASHRMIGSMSERGQCWDNACAESFFSITKRELLESQGFSSIELAKLAIVNWVRFYNHLRPHSACDKLPPVEYEKRLARTVAERAEVGRREAIDFNGELSPQRQTRARRNATKPVNAKSAAAPA